MTSHAYAPLPRTTAWDRAAIFALGAAGCALSYDALQQMAVAIHVRGFLTYLFPLVIDGFIAYGVRALLVLRTAPYRARLYVWTLFATATAASIWANALHAIRLNQLAPPGGGLRLGDVTVGILSTLAPLALAGAVHLHILITRQSGTAPDSAVEPPAEQDADQATDPDPATGEQPPAGPPAEPNAPPDEPRRTRIGRPPEAELDELLDLVRPAMDAHRKPTRDWVRSIIRDADLGISGLRLTQLMTTLRADHAATDGPRTHPE
ncbi:DUF2637 domain-containing protein [Streptomyces sp. NBC_01006]|uniref:DUF2637 domain-containing protein n=1 Tax=Streptomyces sp. NBC_01006 TaxID=2903716 RepID=UPI00386B9373|nr:DUF2637 domain-containing protein [Streptomyces sp. NBC_01006]